MLQRAAVATEETVIDLHIVDLSPGSTFSGFIPFVIDLIAESTIIPRQLVPQNAFPVQGAVKPSFELVRGPAGRISVGRRFSASLARVSPAAKVKHLGNLDVVVVVDSWKSDSAVLGQDALGQERWGPISREEACRVTNFYIVMKLGDALCPAEMELLKIEEVPVWQVTVVHRRTRRRLGELHIAASGKKQVTWHPK